ncbi:MAG: hypothetical protein AAFP82_12170 [Bacteroidota bacterium]
MEENVKICCPKCDWEPDGGEYWMCNCGFVWDTFSTAARCPSCGKQHEETQCIDHVGGCGQFSPHLDWYRNLDKWLKKEVKESFKEVEVPALPSST